MYATSRLWGAIERKNIRKLAPTVLGKGDDPLCFFPNSSHNSDGTVHRQAMKVIWEFRLWAPVLPILLRWGPWMTSLNNRFNLCVFGWLTDSAICSAFFWFIPLLSSCTQDHKPGLRTTGANCLAVSLPLATRVLNFSMRVGWCHRVTA